ncbi:MAG: Gfo/Idh/MocA family oxidoreductase [Lentisphaerae bacterium]|jgi:predicted dehydrogenase|nr:Gfo/Idh/MocA family oxidoreductase [Lentisphaerota bacterium]MBT4816420.1 Gfo/Idh/MocA family oxidoreductase [Lentisphaerota bacterium]MBT5604578.1 Gfo/Idh/MocA family oxidoreductase [Lentisphaerota bacterium]MBT7061751.1 Gfo/Idh/MocA family oxidoreductase [Lentisphaerota bacterium]MBT7848791.1 Gfo/Idh/MocA family oxidoreductase [Lentisphaerota bacterium]
MDKIRVGLVGCGGMARSHATRFSQILDKIEVTGVCDIIKERAEAVAELLPNDPVVTEDYKELFEHVDAALLVLPHQTHYPATMDFLNAGKHVLVEKPMANSEKECRDMIACAEENDRVLMVAYCMRFHPLLLKLKELLDSKAYGECFQLSIWTEQLTRYPEDHWASSAETLGGGQLFSHGCHYIDLMLWYLGQPVRGTHFGTNFGTPWMEREGTSNVTIEFENGAMGYHMGTWGARGTRLRYSFHAHCTEGMLEVDIRRGLLILHSKEALHDPSIVKPEEDTAILMEAPSAKPTEEEMAHFIECINTGCKPRTDAVESLEGLQVIWSLYTAEEEGRLADLTNMGFGSLDL